MMKLRPSSNVEVHLSLVGRRHIVGCIKGTDNSHAQPSGARSLMSPPFQPRHKRYSVQWQARLDPQTFAKLQELVQTFHRRRAQILRYVMAWGLGHMHAGTSNRQPPDCAQELERGRSGRWRRWALCQCEVAYLR